MDEVNLFIDKLKLSAMVVNKEGELIGAYCNLVKRIKAGFLSEKNLKNSLDYMDSWKLLHEIYSFMKNNKLKKISKEEKESHEKLKDIMDKYEDINGEIGFENLKIAYDIMIKFISLAGYHDDLLKAKGGSLDDEEY